MAAVSALVILVAAVAAAYFFRGSNPALTERDTILLVDFLNATGDPVFDGTLKQGLAVQLEQSPFLDVSEESDGGCPDDESFTRLSVPVTTGPLILLQRRTPVG